MSLGKFSHDELFSGSSLEVGKAHWYIQKANTEMNRRRYVENVEGVQRTDFSEEVGPDEIHWWVSKRETEIDKLYERTQTALTHLQRLKQDSANLKEKYQATTYAKLINKIKQFTDSHKEDIQVFLDYVTWLSAKDILAPSMLFTYRVWGATRLSCRRVPISSNNADEDLDVVKVCTEYALGLRSMYDYTIQRVYSNISYDKSNSIDPEYQGNISVPERMLIVRASNEILDELATYFEFLRQSLRNIIVEIKLYTEESNLLNRESFWNAFVTKAMASSRVENQTWDFKETLDMWHIKHKEREVAATKFCEQVAAFANVDGGILIIGVTNNIPRQIVEIQDIENKMKSTKEVIVRHIDYGVDFTHFQPVSMKSRIGPDQICLVIAIAQTKGPVAVKDESGRFSYPIRMETGLRRSSHNAIKHSKMRVQDDNYHFIQRLVGFVYDRLDDNSETYDTG